VHENVIFSETFTFYDTANFCSLGLHGNFKTEF